MRNAPGYETSFLQNWDFSAKGYLSAAGRKSTRKLVSIMIGVAWQSAAGAALCRQSLKFYQYAALMLIGT